MPPLFGNDTNRLPRQCRMRSKLDFDRAFAEGGRARGKTLAIVVCKNGLEHSRFGLSVGRSIWKSAVRRNRIRRVFREAFRLSRTELPEGVDVIMMSARPKLVPKLAEARAELVELAAKAYEKHRAKRERAALEADRRAVAEQPE